MARARLFLPTFDREAEFVVKKPFKIHGQALRPGDAFDKSSVTTRRHRQLYDTRKIALKNPPPERARARNRRPSPFDILAARLAPKPKQPEFTEAHDIEPEVDDAEPMTVKHVGRGVYYVMRGEERLFGPFDKNAAYDRLAELTGHDESQD